MNYGIVVKVLGNLLLFQAAALLPPLGISIYHGEPAQSAFLITIAGVVIVGLVMSFRRVVSQRILVKEAVSIVALSWLFVSFFGAWPLYLSGSIPSFVDAFFESVSGLTTTGATIIDQIEGLPLGILFWRSFLHWLGGMGIIVLTVAILPAIGVGGYQIYKAETPGPTAGKLAPRMRDTAKILYGVYLIMTIVQVGLLNLGGLSLYESFIHTFGTVGTGGFSTRDASIGAFDSSYLTLVIGFFMIAAGVNFSLYFGLYRGLWRRVFGNTELKVYLGVVLLSTVLIVLNLHGRVYGSLFETIQHAFFQVGAFITTTGYTTADYESWPILSQGVLFFLMFVGGSAGSTAGSVKIIRHIVLVKLVRREISRVLHPRAFIPVRVDGKSLTSASEANIIGFFFLYVIIFVLGSLAMMALESLDLLSAASAVAATIGNIGPGFGLVGPEETYSFMAAPAKLLLAFFMLLGRLELFTVLILLTPDFWRERYR